MRFDYIVRIACVCLLTVLLPARANAADTAPLPLFDAHLHYNWEPSPHLPLEQVLTLFRNHRVTGILATSRPNDGTRALYEAKPADVWVVPFIRPYRERSDIHTWMKDETIQTLIEEEYRRGYYHGIGEFHLTGQAATTPLVKHTVDFAVKHDLYLHAHADDAALEYLFEHNPKVRIIWAHTGFATEPDKVEAYLKRYPALWCELSYRYGITAGDILTPAWRRLFETYPDRFLIGSDTWTDARWDNYGAIIAGYRQWLGQLPRDVAEQIAFRNAERLFSRGTGR